MNARCKIFEIIYPHDGTSRLSRLFVGVVIAFSGLAAMAIPTEIISSGLTERISKREIPEPKPTEGERDLSEVRAELREQSAVLKDILAKLSKRT